MLDKLFKIYRSDGHIIFNLLYIKFKFKNFLINQLADCCCIRKLKLGGNVYIGGGGASLHCEGGLTIGFNTKLGEGCFIMTTNHNYKSTTRIPYDNIGLMGLPNKMVLNVLTNFQLAKLLSED